MVPKNYFYKGWTELVTCLLSLPSSLIFKNTTNNVFCLFPAKGYAIFFHFWKKYKYSSSYSKKKSMTQKIHPLRTAKRRGLRIVLRIHFRGFSVHAEKFGTSRPLLRRIGHDRFIVLYMSSDSNAMNHSVADRFFLKTHKLRELTKCES